MIKKLMVFMTVGILASGMTGCSSYAQADLPEGFVSRLSEEQTMMCTFWYADNEEDGNLYFLEQEGGVHSGEYAMEYFIMDCAGSGSHKE